MWVPGNGSAVMDRRDDPRRDFNVVVRAADFVVGPYHGTRRRAIPSVGATRPAPLVDTTPAFACSGGVAQGDGATILFTAFEPSGDFLGAAVIAELRRRAPGVRIVAWGGPKMRAAGAEIIEETGHEAAMGLPGAKKIAEHLAMNKRIGAWVKANAPALHVPVDSPAANFPICEMTKASGAKVVHLAAPQVWAWAQHRVKKLRRLTDLVLCLLPFEEAWFQARGVPARFIGHPMFDGGEGAEADRHGGTEARRHEGGEQSHASADQSRDREGAVSSASGAASAEDRSLTVAALKDTEFARFGLPTRESATPRLAFLPGSRPGEWRSNFPAMLDVWRHVASRWPGAAGAVAASSDAAERALRDLAAAHGGWPERLVVAQQAVDACATWCDAALTVSGTVTLQLTKHGAPMVVMYRIPSWKYWAVGRWVVRSEFATLPNLIAGRLVVPEFVPYAGGPGRIIADVERLLADAGAREKQREGLRAVGTKFGGKRSAEEAAEAILQLLG